MGYGFTVCKTLGIIKNSFMKHILNYSYSVERICYNLFFMTVLYCIMKYIRQLWYEIICKKNVWKTLGLNKYEDIIYETKPGRVEKLVSLISNACEKSFYINWENCLTFINTLLCNLQYIGNTSGFILFS